MDFASFAKSSAVSSPTWKMPRAVKNLGKVAFSFTLMELMIFLADFSPNLSSGSKSPSFQIINIGRILNKAVIQKARQLFSSAPKPSVFIAFLEAK